MWFRMGFSVLHSSLFADAMTPIGSGDRVESRLSLLIQMLCATSEGCSFESPEYLSRRFGVNLKNAKIVWDSCIKNGAFVKLTNGKYSMYYWMEQNGLVGRVSQTKPQIESFCQITQETSKQERDDVDLGTIAERLARVNGHG